MNEPMVRAGAFGLVFAAFAVAEALWPAVPRQSTRAARWTTNLVIAALGGIVQRALATLSLPLAASAAAMAAQASGVGALNLAEWPWWLEFVIAFVALDAALWAQHHAMHRVPLLWRLHRAHHLDRDLDVTSAVRFHPLELGVSMLWKSAAVFVIGAPLAAVVVFEIALNGFAIFNHANLSLPGPLERRLRWLVVTPDMHRIHHSTAHSEHNANYGNCLSIWDRVFSTYVPQARMPFAIGLDGLGEQGLVNGLLTPFRRR